jgi:hypothetical protein
MNNIYQAHLEPIKNKKNLVQEWATYTSLRVPLFMSSFISFCLTQGHPTEAFNIHLNNYPTTWIQGVATKVPFPNAYLYFYMPFISITQISFVFIIPQHQPLLVFILSKNNLPILLSHW